MDKINRSLRRGYFILLSIACIHAAVSVSFTTIEQLVNQPFALRSVTRILVAIAWWLISWAVVFRQLDFTKKLWE